MKRVVIMSVLLSFALQAAESEKLWPTETSFSWSGSEKFPDPIVEIRNREKYELKVTVIQDNQQQTFTIPANKSSFFESKVPVVRVRNLNPNKEIRIDIVYDETKQRDPEFVKMYFKNYTIPAGKKAFISWENDALRPQRGSGGKTQSGISLKKNSNVTQEELISTLAEGPL